MLPVLLSELVLVLLGLLSFLFVLVAALAVGYRPWRRRTEGNAEFPFAGVCVNCGKPTYEPRRLCFNCTQTVGLLWALGEKGN